MTHYTIGIIFNMDLTNVLLIHKLKPEWQKGKLNFPGGKIEPKEWPVDCVVREIFEECALNTKAIDWNYIGEIENKQRDYRVDIFTTVHRFEKHGRPISQTDELIAWYPVNQLPDNIISNLCFLVPFALNWWVQGNIDTLNFATFNYKN